MSRGELVITEGNNPFLPLMRYIEQAIFVV
jgi:hypothetical protein